MALSEPVARMRRIAVVDDSAAVRQSLALLIGARGFLVDAFLGSTDLLAAPDLPGYDCFVIDLKLDGPNGSDLLAVLRQQGLEQPAILISGWDVDSLERVAVKSGFSAQVRKPMMDNSIVDEILKVLSAADKLIKPTPEGKAGSGK
jgi:FixJ family two-component response regulator